jgi:hypothetical protein
MEKSGFVILWFKCIYLIILNLKEIRFDYNCREYIITKTLNNTFIII